MIGIVIFLGAYVLAAALAIRWMRRPPASVWVLARTFLVLSLMPMAIIAVYAVVTGIYQHDGICYGFTDGQWECDYFGQVRLQLIYTVLFTLFLNAVWWAFLIGAGALLLLRRRAA